MGGRGWSSRLPRLRCRAPRAAARSCGRLGGPHVGCAAAVRPPCRRLLKAYGAGPYAAKIKKLEGDIKVGGRQLAAGRRRAAGRVQRGAARTTRAVLHELHFSALAPGPAGWQLRKSLAHGWLERAWVGQAKSSGACSLPGARPPIGQARQPCPAIRAPCAHCPGPSLSPSPLSSPRCPRPRTSGKAGRSAALPESMSAMAPRRRWPSA